MAPSAADGLVLVTGAASRLGVAVTAQLVAQGSAVRTTDTVDIERSAGVVEHWVCELGHDASIAALMVGVRQIVHLEPVSERVVPSLVQLSEEGGDDNDRWLDRCTRCTYNLLDAAARAGVEHLVLGSTMDQFLAVDPNLVLDTSWRPRPGCEPHVLGAHLAEMVAKEYASVGAVQRVTIARLGQILPYSSDTSQSTASTSAVTDSRFWISERDAASELAELITTDEQEQPTAEPYFYIGGGLASKMHPHHRRMTIVHIASDAPRPGASADAEAADAAALVLQRASLVKEAWRPQANVTRPSSAAGGAVVVLGAGGLMGPAVVNHLRQGSAAGAWAEVRATDVAKPADADQALRRARAADAANAQKKDSSRTPSFVTVDVSDKHAVWSAAAGAEALVNCAVSRHGRLSPWQVNCKGVYNSLTAAVSAGEWLIGSSQTDSTGGLRSAAMRNDQSVKYSSAHPELALELRSLVCMSRYCLLQA